MSNNNSGKREYVRGRVYPSTAVPWIRSKREGERPRLTPEDLMHKAEEFKRLPIHEKPKLRNEHSTNPNDELGVVHSVWYDPNDKWLWMEAYLYDHHRHRGAQLLENGIFKKGISLKYSVKGDYKNFIEISLVGNPDFPGAEVEHSHSGTGEDALIWPLSLGQFFPPNYLHYHNMAAPQPQQPAQAPAPAGPQQQQQQQQFPAHELDKYYQKLPNGYLVVYDASKVNAVQQLAISRGIDPRFVIHQDVSGLAGMTEEQRLAFVAATIAENRLATERLKQEEMAKQQQSIQSTFSEIKPIVDYASSFIPEGPDRDLIAQQLAINMATDTRFRGMGEILGQSMQREKQLADENARLKMGQLSPFQSGTQIPPMPLPSMQSQLNNAMYGQGYPQQQQQQQQAYGYQQPMLYAHSAGGTSFPQQQMTAPLSFGGYPFTSGVAVPQVQTPHSMAAMFDQMGQMWRAQQTGNVPSGSPASSSSSTQPSSIFSHSAGQSSSAKRERNPELDKYAYGDFKLFPQSAGGDASQQSASTNDVMIFAHSGSTPAVDPRKRRCLRGSPIEHIPPGGYLGSLKVTSSNQEIMTANLCAIVSGERNIGKVPPDFLTNNLFRDPGLFTIAASGMLNGEPIDNGSLGIGGHGQTSKLPIIERIRARGLEHKYFRKAGEIGTEA